MKKYLMFALTVLLLAPTLAMAESDENVTKRRPDRPSQVEILEIRQEQKGVREEVKEKMEEFRSKVAENHANRLERRFKFYANRLNNIIARFQTRLDILSKDEKKNTTDAKAKLDATSALLVKAIAAGENAVKAFRAIDPTKFSEQKTARIAAQSLAKDALKLFKDTNDALKLALKALKAISKPALPAASAAVQNAQ